MWLQNRCKELKLKKAIIIAINMLFQLFSQIKKIAFRDISDLTIYVETVQEPYGNNY